MNRKWMTLILVLGVLILSGCGISKDTMMAYNEAKDAFQKATLAGAKQCAPCQYATAEAYLAHADHEIAERYGENHSTHLKTAIGIIREKSLEAIKLTPCEPAPPAPAPAPAPTPTPAPEPAPAPAPTPAPAPAPAPPPAPAPAPAPAPSVEPQFDTIYFDQNKTNINPGAAKGLDRNGMLLKDNPKIRVEIGGHTDSTGSAKANEKISEKRALSAKQYLQDKFNISADRMTTKGYGSSKPIADNKTKEGRSKNRRVEFKIIP